jgi:large subunit ribosomal protein L15
VNEQALLKAGIISKCKYGVKILGNGELSKKLTVCVSAFSETAKEKIEAAGGKTEVV